MGFVNGDLLKLLEGPIDADACSAIDMHIEAKDGVTIMTYVNAVPSFAETWLERLYGNIFSSLAHFRIYDGIADTHTYIACKDERVLAVFLYRLVGEKLRVLNEASRLPADEIERFARHIFRSHADVHVVSLHAVALDGGLRDFPLQRYNCLEDIVLRLPGSTGDYLAGLGKSTRAYINRYQNKLRRDFPSVQHACYARNEIQESHIHEILELNRSRMEEKGKRTPWTRTDRRRMLELARMCGMVNVILIDGRICAGTINYRTGDNYFLTVIAHAPEYNDYRLGTLCCFATISRCIAQGGQEYHFLWGQCDYKYRLGGVQRDLDHVSIFRSHRHMLRHAGVVLGNLYRCYDRRLRLAVNEARRRETAGSKHGGLILFLDALRSAWQRHTLHWPSPGQECSGDAMKGNSPT